jgi:hypothetical protein
VGSPPIFGGQALTKGQPITLFEEGGCGPARAGDTGTCHASALQSARHLGDRPGQAGALTDLGTVRRLTGDHHSAVGDLEQALGIYRDHGDRGGEVTTLAELNSFT